MRTMRFNPPHSSKQSITKLTEQRAESISDIRTSVKDQVVHWIHVSSHRNGISSATLYDQNSGVQSHVTITSILLTMTQNMLQQSTHQSQPLLISILHIYASLECARLTLTRVPATWIISIVVGPWSVRRRWSIDIAGYCGIRASWLPDGISRWCRCCSECIFFLLRGSSAFIQFLALFASRCNDIRYSTEPLLLDFR